ncbi:hypothetical protein RI054_09g47350 [Pseudoscourfieldia marina]
MSSFLSSSDSSSDSDDSDSDSDESLLDLLFPYTGNLDPGLQALKDAELSSVGLPPGCAPKNFGRCRRVVGRTGNLNRNRAARLKDMLALRPREFRARYRMSIGNVEENVGNYWCGKGFYGVAMQAIVDAKRGSSGWGFAAGIAERNPPEAWLAGDEAYVCTDSLIVPYSSSSRVYATNASCDDFNFYLARIRITVERAFGVLVGRGIFEANADDAAAREVNSALPETHVHRRADGATVVDGGGSPVVWLNSFRCSRSLDGACGTSETGLGIRVGEATWVAGCAIVFATQ